MGSFQLLDFVGLDVASEIGQVMNTYLSHGFYDDELIEKMVAANVIGGQYPDGSQKDGMFQYEGHQMTGVYSLAEHRYIPFSEGTWKSEADKALGELPTSYIPWKILHKQTDVMPQVLRYFQELSYKKNFGAELARDFL